MGGNVKRKIKRVNVLSSINQDMLNIPQKTIKETIHT